jgi:hypothetical protein
MEIPEFKAFSENKDIENTSYKVLPKQTQPIVFKGVEMEIPQFVFFTDGKNFTLPFKIDAAGLEGWLKSLNRTTDCYFSCQQVYRVIKTLNAKEIPPNLRVTLLDFISIAIIPIVKHLEQPILETKVPLTASEQAHQELITATFALLAQGVWRVAEDIFALPEEKRSAQLLARALFYGLRALKRVLLHACVVYEHPYKGFWTSCYQLYRCAEQFELLDYKIRDSAICSEGGGNCFDGSFKHLLVFYLSGPNQCKPKTIKTLYNILKPCVPYAKIYTNIGAQNINQFFTFSLDQDAPPVCLSQCDEQNSGMRYLYTVKIAKIAYDNLNNETSILVDLRSLKRQKLQQLVKNLGMGAHRKFVRVPVKKNYPGIIGYDNILRFLRNPGSGGNPAAVEPMDPRIAGNWKIPDLELVPLLEDANGGSYKGWQKIADDRNDDANTHVQSIWMLQDDGRGGKIEEFEIVNSSIKGYGMLFKEQNAKVGIGEYVAILVGDEPDKSRIEIGIIHRISQVGRAGLSLGVELLAATAEAVCVYRAGNVLTKNWAVLLRGIKSVKQPDSIIYHSHFFKIGDNICLEQGNKIGYCRINKLLNASSILTHAELLIQR